jgi:hypothetical protein
MPSDAPKANGIELVLEPDEHPAAKPFKAALVGDGIPFTSVAVDDVRCCESQQLPPRVTWRQTEPLRLGASGSSAP